LIGNIRIRSFCRPHCYSGTNYRTIHAFCAGLSLAPRGHAVIKNDEWHHVFCFSLREDAEKLMARFGGEWFDLQTRAGARAARDNCLEPRLVGRAMLPTK
jgi:hypothetical protein